MPYVKPGINPHSPADAPKLLTIFDADLKDFLPAEGRNVPATPYWARLIRDGDVVETAPPPEPTASPA